MTAFNMFLTDRMFLTERQTRPSGPVRRHDVVVPNGATGFDINHEVLEAIDAISHTRLNANGRIARLAIRPATAAATLIYS